MRAFVPNYQLVTPKTLGEALSVLASEPGVWQPFGGGTDLMVLLESGKLDHQNYITIWGLKELRGIEVTDTHVTLGALTSYTEVQANPILRQEFPMLCQAASETGGLAIQNRGTLGGNIANASPAADSPPALLAYDAEVELISLNAARWVPYVDFHTGYKQMIMRADELLARIRLPRISDEVHHYYRKVGTRKAQAISKICFAATARIHESKLNDARIVLGSVAPVPLRCIQIQSVRRGVTLDRSSIRKAQAALAGEIVPIDDIRSTRDYRLKVSLNLLEDFLLQLGPIAQ